MEGFSEKVPFRLKPGRWAGTGWETWQAKHSREMGEQVKGGEAASWLLFVHHSVGLGPQGRRQRNTFSLPVWTQLFSEAWWGTVSPLITSCASFPSSFSYRLLSCVPWEGTQCSLSFLLLLKELFHILTQHAAIWNYIGVSNKHTGMPEKLGCHSKTSRKRAI